MEELRFAPGMFKPETDTYFTYAFVWWLDGRPPIDEARVQDDLLKYFRGLYRAVSKKEPKQVGSFALKIEPDGSLDEDGVRKTRYRGEARWVDPFVTERDVSLNLRIFHWVCAAQDRDHGSRVTAFRESQVIFGCRGAAAMASREEAMLIRSPAFGRSRRTKSRRPSPWLWMSKTSPGLAAGRTTRRLASTVEIAMVGLSHQIPARARIV